MEFVGSGSVVQHDAPRVPGWGHAGSRWSLQCVNQHDVTVNLGIDASIPIDEIGDVFGRNSINVTITDQSGDATPNNGDGNANFNEGYVAGAGHGVIQQTLLQQIGSVLIGPSGAPAAIGPTNNNDDYTNKSVNTGIAGVAPGGVTTALGQLVSSIPSRTRATRPTPSPSMRRPFPPASRSKSPPMAATIYTTVSGGGSVSLPIAFGASANIHVRITEPAGNVVLTGFDSVIRATSTATPAANNRTIDRLYTGFVQLVKAQSVNNATGVGGATDPVPGAVITYTVTYTNVSVGNGGAGCVNLTATNLVITEDGAALPNNWATHTNHVVGATDSLGGGITGDAVGSNLLTDTIASLNPGQSGVFTFMRQIKPN